MKSPAARQQCAARLAALLEAPTTTLAARQYICLQFRQVGTAEQVSALARLLTSAKTSSMACSALESIPGEEARQALVAAAQQLEGRDRIGIINALGKRREGANVVVLDNLAGSHDNEIREAAWRALANIGDVAAASALENQARAANDPLPPQLAVSLLRCVKVLVAAGKRGEVQSFYERLTRADYATAFRRAGWEGLLELQREKAADTIAQWLPGDDILRRRIAMGHLDLLSDAQLTTLSAEPAALSPDSLVAVMEVLARRNPSTVLPKLMQMAHSEQPQQRLAAVRLLGVVGGKQVVPHLISLLGAGGPVDAAAGEALEQLPRDAVGPALLKVLDNPSLRRGAVEVLKRLRYYEAIDPLIVMATDHDPATYNLAMDGLRGIADPDQTDLPRLLQLVLQTEPGAQRDEAEKTFVIVCQKQSDMAARRKMVSQTMGGLTAPEQLAVLPLLGRLGDPQALATIEKYMSSGNDTEREAAVRSLCNWPDASVAGRLMTVVRQGDGNDQRFRRWALRAYVRVVSLPSKRSAGDTLAMLQQALKQADVLDDQRLIVERAGSVRSMESVRWLAQFLDQPELAQQACASLVELAHHRELRHPNMQQFGPLLEKVARVSRDPQIAECARRYRLGL